MTTANPGHRPDIWRPRVDDAFVRNVSRLCRPERITLLDLSSGERMAGAPLPRRLRETVRRQIERLLIDDVADLDDAGDRYRGRILEEDGAPRALAILSGSGPLPRTPEREERFAAACDLIAAHLGDRQRAIHGENEGREHRENLDFLLKTFSLHEFSTRDLNATLNGVLENLKQYRQIEGGLIYIEPVHASSVIDRSAAASEPLEPALLRAVTAFVGDLTSAVFVDDPSMIRRLLGAPVDFSGMIAAPIRCGRRLAGGVCPLHLGQEGDGDRYPCPCWTGGVFLWNRRGQPFNRRDRDFVRIIVERLIFHFLYHNINNERRREREEREIARRIQLNLLPRTIPGVERTEIKTYNVCAEVVGGDFYEFHAPHPSALIIAIGDISGKSVPAALLHSLIQRVLRDGMARYRPEGAGHPGEILTRVNAELYDSLVHIDMFSTLFVLRLDTRTGRIEFANAGHARPIVYRAASGATETLDASGMPIGFMPDATYETVSGALWAGDRALLYTDGMSEVFDAGHDMFGDDRLRRTLVATAGLPVDRALSGIVAAIREFSNDAAPRDDQTAILCRFDGPGGEATIDSGRPLEYTI